MRTLLTSVLLLFISPAFAQHSDTIAYRCAVRFTPDCFGIYLADTLKSPGYFVLTATDFKYRGFTVPTYRKGGKATHYWVRNSKEYHVRYRNTFYLFIL